MGFTDETVRFNLDDSNRKELARPERCLLVTDEKATIQLITVGYVLSGDPATPVIIMHETKL